MTIPQKLLIIGCGNMAGAMLAGWLAAGFDRTRFAVLTPTSDDVPEGIALYRTPVEAAAAGDHDAILLGFKPQQLPALAPQMQALAGAGVAVHSLLAGLTLAQLRQAFPDAAAHVRVMPNLAARIGKSPVIIAQTGIEEGIREPLREFYDALGTALWLEDETQFNLTTALAGSGPGFVYRFIDALAGAASDLGLQREQADRLALAMVEGAAALADRESASPGELADRVASPGGMTREGLNVLDDGDALRRLLADTLRATAERGSQLSGASG